MGIYNEESIMFKTTLKKNKFGVMLDLKIHKAPVNKKVCYESQYSRVVQQGKNIQNRPAE